MSIVTISRGSYSYGKEVAEKVAERLGYECIARDVLIEASKEFNTEEVKLVHAISAAPSIFDRISYGKQRYIAYIRSALLEHFRKDNIVYHGLAGHFFVRDITHVLKVRIVADMDDRIQNVMKRDGVSRKVAQRFIQKIDKDRKNWSQKMYGFDAMDALLYDLVIHISKKKITVDAAVDIIYKTTMLSHFQSTDESRRKIEDEALAAMVTAALIKDFPEADVAAQDGLVSVSIKTTAYGEQKISEQIEKITLAVPGVKEVKVHLHWLTPFST